MERINQVKIALLKLEKSYWKLRTRRAERKLQELLYKFERTGKATINGIECEEYGEGWDDCIEHLKQEVKK